jgi:glycine/D-amino acid oxidase-like deaminating enzyme
MREALRFTRRAVMNGMAGGVSAVTLAAQPGGRIVRAAAGDARPSGSGTNWTSIVIGAGAFGSWTAWNLLRKGERVLLLDAWGPAHARASSGGESRVTRTAYGADEIYTRMAWDSLTEWRWLSERAGLPVFHQTGVLFFFQRVEPYVTQTLEVHRRLKLSTEELHRPELAKRFPQVNWDGVEVGLYEPQFGALMARRAVLTLVAEFVKAGGEYRTAAIAPLETSGSRAGGTAGTLDGIRTQSGETLRAEKYLFACGPWLPKVFPATLGDRIFPTRQEVFFFASEAGDPRFQPGRLPTWADFNGGDIFYGMPDLESRGFKIAHDKHGPPIDPDTGDRIATPAASAEVRAFMKMRFPALAARPLVESRVCQYENSSNGDLLIDRHPTWQDVWLIGAGSGHGFKHAPAVGRYAADLATRALKTAEPRFSLASKATVQNRLVH